MGTATNCTSCTAGYTISGNSCDKGARLLEEESSAALIEASSETNSGWAFGKEIVISVVVIILGLTIVV